VLTQRCGCRYITANGAVLSWDDVDEQFTRYLTTVPTDILKTSLDEVCVKAINCLTSPRLIERRFSG
jgi:hypothetical protein